MKNHLSKFNLINNVSTDKSYNDDIVFNRISMVEILFDKDGNDKIILRNIETIDLLDNDRLLIENSLYSQDLYEAYVNEKNIYMINVSGNCVNVKNHTELVDFETSFRGYEFEDISGSINTGSVWKYTLKRIEQS